MNEIDQMMMRIQEDMRKRDASWKDSLVDWVRGLDTLDWFLLLIGIPNLGFLAFIEAKMIMEMLR